MSFGNIIRKRREDMGLTQDQLAVLVDISKPYLSTIETGKANPPSDEVLASMELALKFKKGDLTSMANLAKTPIEVRKRLEELQMEVDHLRTILKELMAQPRSASGSVDISAMAKKYHGPEDIQTITAGRAVPVINGVSAGYPAHFTDLDYPLGVADEYIRCPDLHDPQAFAARVVGDSMEPSYRSGDIVVFAPNTPAKSGDDCFVRFESDGGTTFKRAYSDDEETVRLQPLNNKYAAQAYPRADISGLWPAVFRIERLRT